MAYRNPLRGVHAPHTRNTRIVRLDEIESLGLLNAGSISIIDYQLQDDRFVEYLEWAASDGMEIYCRLFTQGALPPSPVVHAEKLKNLVDEFPFVKAWLPCNEPNLEWPNLTVDEINEWLKQFWWNAQHYRNGGVIFRMLYPPMAQDMGGERNQDQIYWGLHDSVQLFADDKDGFSWHSYWNTGNLTRLIENELPPYIRAIIDDPLVPTLIHEAGRKTDDPGGVTNLINEIVPRFGSARNNIVGASKAKAVTFWLLSSDDPAFSHQAFIDRLGGRRQVLYDVAWFGP